MEHQLENVDPEDISELIHKIESSLNIQYQDNELYLGMTFGEFCELTIRKIPLKHQDNCTTQQAFYKIRKALADQLKTPVIQINPHTSLHDTLPQENRYAFVKKLERNLGFRLHLLKSPFERSCLPEILLSFACIGGIFNYKIIVTGSFLYALALFIRKYWNRRKPSLKVATIKDFIQEELKYNYVQIRRNTETFNKNEIERLLVNWFSDELGLDKSQLNPNAIF